MGKARDAVESILKIGGVIASVKLLKHLERPVFTYTHAIAAAPNGEPSVFPSYSSMGGRFFKPLTLAVELSAFNRLIIEIERTRGMR